MWILSATLVDAQDANAVENHADRIIAVVNAYRAWTLSHAEEYSLIFGSPIPDYHAPMEITGLAAAGSMSLLIQVLNAAYQDGKLATGELDPALGEMLQPWIKKLDYTGPPAIIHLALVSWAQIHGLVSLELFGHLTAAPECNEVDALFEAEIQAMVARMGIE
ncbi:MAG: WHG domain-containing protein [Desulfobacteraceae bacterium]|nr:WHG domain-containing protein [Desulfobacteraceae bacterium]